MGLTLKENKNYEENSLTGEEIVISGISGLFPKSNNAAEFMDNLYNKVDMVTPNNLSSDHPEAPKHYGKITGTKKFDAQFFSVTYNQAMSLEPMSRKLMEHAYGAIYDSGINPLQCKGTKIGVFIGASYMDSGNVSMYNALKSNGFIISGASKTMLSNRISYWLDGKAPSYTLDCTCSSTIVCLENAYNCIKTGVCESALVGGCQLCIHPILSLNLKRSGFLCLDGKTKCFDKNGDGYVRSEAISMIFLQKAKDAKRIYTEIFHGKTKYGLKDDVDFFPLRKSEEIEKFLEDFYLEAGVSPKEVEYVEAHGAAIAEADANELTAIGKIFGKEKPVLVGSVKSNMGNSEAASGVCALTKMCLAYQRGEIPANLHYSESLDIPAIQDRRVEVLTDIVSFARGFTALNNFSYTGLDAHVLLKGHFKSKDIQRYKTTIPRLVLISGRQDTGVGKIQDILKSRPIDPELIGMLHNIYHIETIGHTCRGYSILDTDDKNETCALSESIKLYPGSKRPLVFLFSGMGSQWAGMGAELMRIPIFAAAIEKCRKVLEPKGVDIVRIITERDDTIFDYILNCFVGIAAVQIGLADILKEMDLVPDYIIGHSVGEMGCSYFDGCFTTEEMILAAYVRGLVSVETELIKGSMAAVGLGYKDILPICPPDIDIACHNSSTSSTISGPEEAVKQFIADLTAKGFFAKAVPCANIPYHSRYIQKAGPEFLKRLGEIIKHPVLRSEKWICTSLPREKWDDPIAKYSSPEYHTNNLLSPVYFEESARLIPKNAVVVEVAPHGLLQGILRRSHPECTLVPLTSRGCSDSVEFLLGSIGKLYQEGYNPNVSVLYPKIQFPVSTETPLISHFVEWDHRENWTEAIASARNTIVTPIREFAMSIQDDDFKFIAGHSREGKNVFPEAAILFLVWETLAMYKGVQYKDMSVAFRDVHFQGKIVIDPEDTVKLSLAINKGNDYFEVKYMEMILAYGYVSAKSKIYSSMQRVEIESKCEDIHLNSEDIYRILNLKGHSYEGEFQSICSSSLKRNTARIKWTGNWVTFLDSLIQLNILERNFDGLSVPMMIKQLTINISDHLKENLKIIGVDACFDAQLQEHNSVTRCGGVEIRDIIFNVKPIIDTEPDVLETLTFIPHNMISEVDIKTALQINLQIVAENLTHEEISVTELINTDDKKLSDIIEEVAEYIPGVKFNIKTVTTDIKRDIGESNLFVARNLLSNELIEDVLKNCEFLLIIEDKELDLTKNNIHNVVSSMTVDKKNFALIKRTSNKHENAIFIPIKHDTEYTWLPQVQNELQNFRKVILIFERQHICGCGLSGFIMEMKKEYQNKVGLIVIDDILAPPFDPEIEFFKQQLKKEITLNVFRKGHWGGFYYLPSPKLSNAEMNFTLINKKIGDIDSLQWAEFQNTSDRKNVVQVHYAGVSVRDVQKAVGLMKKDYEDYEGFGMDYSGFDNQGNRVMGLVATGALSNIVQPDPDLLWPVPKHWTLEEAATVPLPFIHAYYCLIIKGQIFPKHSIFVTGGAGALGQAVISICLALGCTVYTSVGDIWKKRFLMKLFPQLNENNIGYSYDSDFYNMVIFNSKNRRCDFVINCIRSDMREFAMKCVGPFGIFLDVNNYDMKQDIDVGMYFFQDDKTYIAVNVSNVFEDRYDKELLQMVLSDGIAKGIVKPISHIVYPNDDISRAFRFLSLNKHRGRVLIKIRDTDTTTKHLNVVPRMSYLSKGKYIVLSDKTDLGIELVNRLVIRGARNVLLHMQTKTITGYLHLKLAQWNKSGAKITISTEKLKTESDCARIIREENITGIFILQEMFGIDNDGDQKKYIERWNNVISVVNNMDLVSRNNCPQLRYFFLITKNTKNVVDLYSTSILEKICEARSEIGLPALILHTQFITEKEPQSIQTTLNAMETSLKQKNTNVLAYNVMRCKQMEYLNKLASIIGVKNIHNLDENLTMKDLKLNEINIEEIRCFIYETIKQDYNYKNITEMTISSLKNMSVNRERQNTKFNSGLGAFYTFIDDDEYMATDVFIPMPSLLSSLDENEQYVDGNCPHLMLIPGFEGHHHIFKPLCERLKIRAATFQLGPDMTTESIPKMALSIKQFMKRRLNMQSKFYLLGYSFGLNVALEVAALLEKEGHVGVIYCLDSSPDALRVQMDAYIGKLSEAELQNTIIEHIFNIMTGQTSDDLKSNIEAMENWEDKIDAYVNKLKEFANYSIEYERTVVQTAYKRIMLARNYKPDMKLESELVLLKGINHPNAEALPDDYNLSKFTKKKLKIFQINSDVALATQDCRVTNIVNKMLDTELLEDFKTKNLCETYLSAPFKIQ